jgi:integrase
VQLYEAKNIPEKNIFLMKNYSFKLRQHAKTTDPVIEFHLFESRFKGRRFMYSTGYHIEPGEWKKSTQRPKDNQQLSKHLDLIVSLAAQFLEARFSSKTLDRGDLKNYILDHLKDEQKEAGERELVRLKEAAFSKDWEGIIKTTKTKKGKLIKKGTLTQKRQTLTLMETYAVARKITLTFNTITIAFYHDFDAWMIEQELCGNTRGKHMKEIKAVLREAIERDIPVCLDFQKKSWRVIKEPVDRVYLNTEELKKFILKDDLPEEEAISRDIFVMACFVGARHSDWHQIKKENIVLQDKTEILRYKQTKGGAIVHIPLHPVVKMILRKYKESPKVPTNQSFNKELKTISRNMKLGTVIIDGQIKKKSSLITTHTARRSFATNAFLSKSLDTQLIMKCTGHKTEESFKKYLKLDGIDYAQLASESKFFTEDWTLLKIAQ